MLSKNTQTFLTTLLRASHSIKPRLYTPLYQALPTTASFTPLHNYSRCFFASSEKNDSNTNDLKTDTSFDSSEKFANPKKEKLKVVGKREKSKVSPELAAEKVSERRLQSIPIRPTRLPVIETDSDKDMDTFVLFNSTTPIIPHSHQNGLIKTGYLGTSHISNKLAFFLQNPFGEIYTVGIILEDNVNSSLKKTITGSSSNGANPAYNYEDKNKYRTEISIKPKNYKIKLSEIEFRDNCIFAKAVPYPDAKLTEAEKKVNVHEVLDEIKHITDFLRVAFSYEKIDAFNGFSVHLPKEKRLDTLELDKILCNALAECLKLSNYTKENLHNFVQFFLEERSIITRLFMIKKKLEEVKNIMAIVSQSVQDSDGQIWKNNESAKARLSFEYIRSNYFGGEPGAGVPKGTGNTTNKNDNPNIQGPAKKFMEKLPLIKDEVSRDKVRKEIERFSLQDKSSSEYHKLYTYLDDIFSIPWDNFSEEHWDIDYSHKVLEKELFGLEKVKERIVEMIAVNKLKRVGSNSNDSSRPEKKKGFVILLNGPPGVGKTTIAKAIAKALKRESRFISFAGVTDPAFVKGHKRTYLDAQPGVFVKELTKAKVMNPVFILDEVDKLGKHQQGVDPYYSLMEILNPEENQNFGDHYLDIKVDFSNVIFILTSNNALNMLEPLRNRLEVIEVPSYIEQDKLRIAKNYLLPSVLAENGLNSQSISFDDETLIHIIKGWCYYESGVRELRRCLEKISRKHALEILDNVPTQRKVVSPQSTLNQSSTSTSTSTSELPEQVLLSQNIEFQDKSLTLKQDTPNTTTENGPLEKNHSLVPVQPPSKEEISHLKELRNQHKLVFDASKDPNDEALKRYLGLPVFDDMYGRKDKKLRTGTANVLTVSGFVGHVMSVECVFDATNPHRKGQFTCSGNLQKVLQESLTIARLVAMNFLPAEKIKEISDKNIHIHFLQGAIPKDGPSAGISICSALISIALGKPIDSAISMTGELSLNGEVYKIGGVQAKVTASKALDIKKIILPYGNRADFFELPQMLKDGLEVYFVKEYREVFNILFGDSPKQLESIEKCKNGKVVSSIRGPGGMSISCSGKE